MKTLPPFKIINPLLAHHLLSIHYMFLLLHKEVSFQPGISISYLFYYHKLFSLHYSLFSFFVPFLGEQTKCLPAECSLVTMCIVSENRKGVHAV